MSTVLLGACLITLVSALLILLRALKGPTVYDRILAVNAMGTKTVVFLSLLGFLGGRTGFLDIALLYALINYVATIAILRFIVHRRLG